MKVFAKEKSMKRIVSVFFAFIILFCCSLWGCGEDQDPVLERPTEMPTFDGFCVNFIDVGNGDCIFISFADGKNMMIDCGQSSTRNFNTIKSVVNNYANGKINYLVLTHPDIDHVGNAVDVINAYEVEKAFIPNIYALDDYYTFKQAKELLEQKGVPTTFSSEYVSIQTEDYIVAFLSPLGKTVGGYYGEFNAEKEPSDVDVNNLSPIIFVEYNGVRFLLTGDAGKAQEKLLLNYIESKLPTHVHGREINIVDIDVLKVAHHGSEDCTSDEFLEVINPDYAVFSVGNDNVYGHPSSQTINRLYNRNADIEILRTDVSGTITVGVDTEGKITILKQSD